MLSRVLAIAAISVSPALVHAQGIVVPVPCTADRCVPAPCPPGIVCTGGPANLVHRSSEARVELDNGVLRYEITEVIQNTGSANGEVDYMFPLPKMAAFQDLAMTIDGEMIAGEILPADRARTVYESIVRTNRDPALVEWMGHGLLRTRIFPIAPGEEKRVVVRLQSVAQREGDAIRVDYFVGTRRAAGSADRGTTTSLTFNYPDSARYGAPYSPTHTVDNATALRGKRAISVSGSGSEITVLLPVRNPRSASISVLSHAVPNENGFALITLTPPQLAPRSTPRDVVFVLDVSGSMAGTKMVQARAAGKQLLSTLRPEDRFRIVNFATDVGFFEPGFVPATREAIGRAGEYLDALEASGSTNIMSALDEALRSFATTTGDRLPIVLFVTDGAPTVGETRTEAIARRVTDLRGRARVFTFGLGSDVKADLLEQLAIEGRGTAQMVRPAESVERAVSLVASRLTSPIVTDLRLRASGVRLQMMHPGDVSDLFAGQDMVIMTRYAGSGRSTLNFEGVSADGPVNWSTTVEFPERDIRNPFVARLWATQRVGFLSAERRRNGPNPELDQEIRTLGERYSIPTMFTSYMVIEPGLVITQDGRLVAQPEAANLAGRGAAPAATPPASGGSGRGGRGGGAAGGAVQGGVAASFRVAENQSSFERAALDQQLRSTRSEAALTAALAAGKAKRVGNRVFVMLDSTWVDTQYSDSLSITKIKPFSAVYFELVRSVPELAAVFALGERVLVTGKKQAISLDESGAESLAKAELDALMKEW